MNATPISQVEKATNIPDGSLHLVEMGDGSGTKTVTQETLIEEMGKRLKIGSLNNLQTENKNTLVEAINEVAQSGGGGTSAPIDILDTKEEIEANTEQGKAAGAQAVKEMFGEINNNLVSRTARRNNAAKYTDKLCIGYCLLGKGLVFEVNTETSPQFSKIEVFNDASVWVSTWVTNTELFYGSIYVVCGVPSDVTHGKSYLMKVTTQS